MSEKYFKVKNGVTTPSITFNNQLVNSNVSVSYLESNTLSFTGTSGQLLSITDTMTGTIFAVNDISGVPSIEVFDTGNIQLAETFGNILIGTATDNITDKVQISGNVAVTGTVAGRNLTTDGSKLDGIEAGATADQTAAEILTAIKTVDGTGSGLDADLLDGNQASAFYLATNPSGYIAGNQTITLSGDLTGSGTTSINAQLAANVVGANELNVVGNGTTAQYLRSDGDGTFTWATPTDTNTTYSVGNGGLTEINFTSALNTKLTGIEAGATADQTAAEILAALVTVDGAGSGLDADLLDGQSSAYYATAASVAAVAALDPVLTLAGDATGTATFTNLGNATLTVAIVDDSHNHIISNVDGLQAALDSKLATSLKGATNGLAELDATGKVPTAQLPSYVDDVLEYTNLATFPTTGETGKIYLALDTNDIYRWSGSAYIIISASVGNADTATKLATARAIALGGAISGTANFDGSTNITITSSIAANAIGATQLNVVGNGTTAQYLRSDGDGTFTWATPTDTNTTYSVGNGGLTEINFTSALNTKLAGIEAGATADQTAAEILTAIKTVDGAGSGLDADLLDGLTSASFLRSDTTSYYNQIIQAGTGVPTNNLGSPSITEMALFDGQFNNKTEFFPPTNVFIETSTDNVTWVDAGFSDTQKKRFVGGDISTSGVYIPNGTAYFRVRFKAISYVFLNALYSYWSGSGHSTKVQVYKKLYNTTTWVQHTSSTTTVGSWPGHLYLPFNSLPFNTTNTSQYDEVAIVFIPTWSATYPSNNITLYSMQIWGGYPSGRRNVYSVDEDKQVYFPTNTYSGGARNLTTSDEGAGNGLDADLLDGQQGSYYQPASTAITTANIGSQSVASATTSGSTTGNAGSATVLQTARTINGVSFNGSANITVADATKLPLAGGTATGTINAPTFNATSVTDGGFQGIDSDTALIPSFTWTSDQNTGIWHAAADQIGFTTAGVNRLTLSTTALTSTLGISAPTFTGTLTGNASTATILQTARTINGVSFNGSANITVADATKLPLTGGTTTGTINAPTFNATSVTDGGFQGIDADTALIPSFTWTGDLNTGMWHAAADAIGFTTAGTNRITVDNSGMTINSGNLTHTTVSSRDKIRLWSDSNYTIGMQTAYTFGPINNDYAMTFQMNNASSRGFWWGDVSHTNAQGAMALSTDGKLTIAHSARLGYGEADTTIPGATYRLDVSGDAKVTGSVTASSFVGDGSGLTGISGGATISTSAPAGASSGTLWWDSEAGKLFIYYVDATSSQWVEASAPSSPFPASLDLGAL